MRHPPSTSWRRSRRPVALRWSTLTTSPTPQELERYGVKANAIAPAARTRLTMATPGASDGMLKPVEVGFDEMDPANVSPFVAYLATADCPIKGRVFFVAGGGVHLFQPFA